MNNFSAIPNAGPIAYDKKVLKSISDYMKNSFRQHADEQLIHDTAATLDVFSPESGADRNALLTALLSSLPSIKKALHIDETHKLKDQLPVHLRNEGLLDRLLNHQISLYFTSRYTSGSLINTLDSGSRHNRKTKEHTIISHPQKSIIARIIILMIAQDEIAKQESHTKNHKKHLPME